MMSRWQVPALGSLFHACLGLDPVVLGQLLPQKCRLPACDRRLVQGSSWPSNSFLNHLLADFG